MSSVAPVRPIEPYEPVLVRAPLLWHSLSQATLVPGWRAGERGLGELEEVDVSLALKSNDHARVKDAAVRHSHTG